MTSILKKLIALLSPDQIPSSRSAFIRLRDGQPDPSKTATPRRTNALVWGPGRSGTTAVTSLLKEIGFSLSDRAFNTVLEDELLAKYLLEGDWEPIENYIRAYCTADKRMVFKLPKFRANPDFLRAISDQCFHIVCFRCPLSISLRNFDEKSDLEETYQRSVAELTRSAQLAIQLSGHGCEVVLYMHEHFKADPNKSLNDLVTLLGLEKPTLLSAARMLVSLESVAVRYKKKHETMFFK